MQSETASQSVNGYAQSMRSTLWTHQKLGNNAADITDIVFLFLTALMAEFAL